MSLCRVLLLLRVELQEFEAVLVGAFDRVQDVRRHAQHLACGKRHARIGQHHACRALHQYSVSPKYSSSLTLSPGANASSVKSNPALRVSAILDT